MYLPRFDLPEHRRHAAAALLQQVVEAFEDMVAERGTALGAIADARVKMLADTTGLREYPAHADRGASHLKALAGSLGQFGKLLSAAHLQGS